MPLQEKDKNQFFDEMNFENSSIYYSLICSEPEKNEKLGTFIMHHSKKKKKKKIKNTPKEHRTPNLETFGNLNGRFRDNYNEKRFLRLSS